MQPGPFSLEKPKPKQKQNANKVNAKIIENHERKCAHFEGRRYPSYTKHHQVKSNNTRPSPRTTHWTHQAKDHPHPPTKDKPQTIKTTLIRESDFLPTLLFPIALNILIVPPTEDVPNTSTFCQNLGAKSWRGSYQITIFVNLGLFRHFETVTNIRTWIKSHKFWRML